MVMTRHLSLSKYLVLHNQRRAERVIVKCEVFANILRSIPNVFHLENGDVCRWGSERRGPRVMEGKGPIMAAHLLRR